MHQTSSTPTDVVNTICPVYAVTSSPGAVIVTVSLYGTATSVTVIGPASACDAMTPERASAATGRTGLRRIGWTPKKRTITLY